MIISKRARLNKTIFLLLSLISFNAYSVTVNDQHINTLAKPGELVLYTDPKANNMCLCVKDGNVIIGSLELKNIERLKDFRKELEEIQDQLCRKTSQNELVMRSGQKIALSGAYISGENKVLLDAGSNITISDAIIKSKKIVLAGKELKLNDCFTEAEELHIVSRDPKSIFKTIIFKLNKSIPVPAAVHGHINFQIDETTGNFIVVGAQEVAILFTDFAFKSK